MAHFSHLETVVCVPLFILVDLHYFYHKKFHTYKKYDTPFFLTKTIACNLPVYKLFFSVMYTQL